MLVDLATKDLRPTPSPPRQASQTAGTFVPQPRSAGLFPLLSACSRAGGLPPSSLLSPQEIGLQHTPKRCDIDDGHDLASHAGSAVTAQALPVSFQCHGENPSGRADAAGTGTGRDARASWRARRPRYPVPVERVQACASPARAWSAIAIAGRHCRGKRVRSRHDIVHWSIRARVGSGNDGRGTRNQAHPGREIRDAAAGVQNNKVGDAARKTPGDDKSKRRSAKWKRANCHTPHDKMVQNHSYRPIRRTDGS